VSPALAANTETKLLGEVWKRPALSPRDRSLVTVAALISRNQTVEMPYYFKRALDDGGCPSELSEIIFHLAFYSGWPNAMAAVVIANDIFIKRGVRPDQLPAVSATSYRWMRPLNKSERRGLRPTWVRFLRAWSSTPVHCFFMISGCGPPWRRADPVIRTTSKERSNVNGCSTKHWSRGNEDILRK
jgi:alkylhydroperoxidase/carboxymuconolactone decarboxylase family protein YurZ